MTERKFNFSLTSVLKLRQRSKQEALQQLATIMKTRRDYERRLEEARAYEARLIQGADVSGGAVSSPSLRRKNAHREEAQQAIQRLRSTLDEIRSREAEARRALEEAHQAEEALQVLYEEEAASHKEEVRRAEINFLDEQAMTRHFRNQQNGA